VYEVIAQWIGIVGGGGALIAALVMAFSRDSTESKVLLFGMGISGLLLIACGGLNRMGIQDSVTVVARKPILNEFHGQDDDNEGEHFSDQSDLLNKESLSGTQDGSRFQKELAEVSARLSGLPNDVVAIILGNNTFRTVGEKDPNGGLKTKKVSTLVAPAYTVYVVRDENGILSGTISGEMNFVLAPLQD